MYLCMQAITYDVVHVNNDLQALLNGNKVGAKAVMTSAHIFRIFPENSAENFQHTVLKHNGLISNAHGV